MKKILLLLGTTTLLATEEIQCPEPWFTGPLLTPSAHIVPVGYYNVEPYLFYNSNTGNYNNDWQGISHPHFNRVTLLPLLYIGITEWMDFLFAPRASWKTTEGRSHYTFDDLNIHIGFQILEDTKTNSLPAIKLVIQENFPTGKYQKGDPAALGTDIGGDGSYQTSVGIVFGRMLELPNCHFLSLRLSGLGTYSTPVGVKGINAFGGAPNTDARVYIGQTYLGLFGLEYSFTQNWVFAFDAQALYQTPTTYKGFPGTLPNGEIAPLGNGESLQFSIAPALEYNFSAALGLIGGVWFSFAGKNAPRFFSGVIALNYVAPFKKSSAHKHRARGGSGAASGGSGR